MRRYGRNAGSLSGVDSAGCSASPFERAASWAGERRRVDERGLDILLAEPAAGGGGRTVSKKGLRVGGGVYIAAELGPLVGARVAVRLDPADYGRVHVFDGGGRFVCVAEDPVRTGIDRREVAAWAKALAAQANGEARAWARDLKRRRKPVSAIDDVLDRAAEDAARLVAFPAPAEVHRSPGLDAAARAQDAADEADTPPERRRTGTGGVGHIDILKKFYLEGDRD